MMSVVSNENGNGEQPEQEFQQFIYNIEAASQRRPVVRFGALVLGVAIGSYYGVGRHVVKTGKDVRIIRDYVAAIGSFAEAEWSMRDSHADIIRQAMEAGREVRHFPGVGVWVEAVKK